MDFAGTQAFSGRQKRQAGQKACAMEHTFFMSIRDATWRDGIDMRDGEVMCHGGAPELIEGLPHDGE